MPETIELGSLESLISSTHYGLPDHPEFGPIFEMAFQVNLAMEARGCSQRCIVSAVPPRQIGAYIGDCCVWDSELREFGSIPTWQEAVNIYAAHLKAESVALDGDPLEEEDE